MKSRVFLESGEKGAITVFFILISGLLVGMVSYSLYVGQMVSQKIELQNAGDASTLAMANEGAQGLNMISANNLAVGASIHINTSVEILASYLSMYRALSASATDLVELVSIATDAAGIPNPLFVDRIQGNVWNVLAPLSSYLFRVGSGTVEFNDFISKYWLYPAPIRGSEILRLNKPDSIFLPLQMSQLGGVKIPLMAYAGLRKTSPKETVCQSIQASRDIDQGPRDAIILWLMGPLQSLGIMRGGGFEVVEKVIGAISQVMPLKIGYMGCGYGLKTPLFTLLDSFSKNVVKNEAVKSAANLVLIEGDGKDSGVVSSYMSEVRNTDFHCGNPGVDCKAAAVFCEKLVSRISEGIGTFEGAITSKLIDSFLLAKTIQSLKDGADSSSCQDKKGYLTLTDRNGQQECLKIADINKECPKWEAFREADKVGFLCSEQKNHMNENIDGGKCAGYQRWKKNAQQNPEPQKDSGVSIRDTSKQAEAFASDEGVDVAAKQLHWKTTQILSVEKTNKPLFAAFQNSSEQCGEMIHRARKRTKIGSMEIGVDNEARDFVCDLDVPSEQHQKGGKKQLSFIIPGHMAQLDDFERSLRFGAIVTVPLRTRKEIPIDHPCDDALKNEDIDQKKHCDFTPVISLVSNQGADSTATGKAMDAINLNQAGMTKLVQNTENAQASFSSEWQRSQWILSESRVKHRPTPQVDPEPSSQEMRTFYPAWTSVFSTMTASSIATSLKPLLSSGNNADKPLALISQIKGSPNGQ